MNMCPLQQHHVKQHYFFKYSILHSLLLKYKKHLSFCYLTNAIFKVNWKYDQTSIINVEKQLIYLMENEIGKLNLPSDFRVKYKCYQKISNMCNLLCKSLIKNTNVFKSQSFWLFVNDKKQQQLKKNIIVCQKMIKLLIISSFQKW